MRTRSLVFKLNLILILKRAMCERESCAAGNNQHGDERKIAAAWRACFGYYDTIRKYLGSVRKYKYVSYDH